MNYYIEEDSNFYFVYDENTNTDYRFYKDQVLASAIRVDSFYVPTQNELEEAACELLMFIRRKNDFC